MQPHFTAPEYLKLSDLKKALDEVGHHITTRTLRYLCANGEIAYTRVGSLYKIHRDEVARVLADRGSHPSREKAEGPRVEKWTEQDALRKVMYRYGISEEEYAAMCEAVDHRCTICRCKPEEKYAHLHAKSRKLQIDHDHATGRIRGMLCQACNKRVSFVGDSPEKIRRLLDYVEGRITPAAQLSLLGRGA